jgi:hypothetical protein
MAELGVLTDQPEADLASILDRGGLAASLGPRHCGEPSACDAVRAVLRDAHATTFDIVAASDWDLAHADLDASAHSLTRAERARLPRKPRIVVIHVAVPTSPRALALRAAFAAAAAIAEQADGIVWDQLLARIEPARAFTQHAVTEPLEASAFRADRIEVLYEPAEEGVVRILTAGLSRWGAPDVEAQHVPATLSGRMAQIVVGVAQAIADGATAGPIAVSLPDTSPVSIELISVQPASGDPNDFLARIRPPGGEGVVYALELVERVFGSAIAAPAEEEAMRAAHEQAQARLAAALSKWTAARSTGDTSKLLLQLPFAIPGDAGIESMWIEVTRYDARTVTGKVIDEPLGATDVARGDEVTRPRSGVEGIELRAARRDGGP